MYLITSNPGALKGSDSKLSGSESTSAYRIRQSPDGLLIIISLIDSEGKVLSGALAHSNFWAKRAAKRLLKLAEKGRFPKKPLNYLY